MYITPDPSSHSFKASIKESVKYTNHKDKDDRGRDNRNNTLGAGKWMEK